MALPGATGAGVAPIPRRLTFPANLGNVHAVSAAPSQNPVWHEILDAEGRLRPPYGEVLGPLRDLRPADLRLLHEHMEAALREMGMSGPQGRPWHCDLLPHIFTESEWATVVAGFQQRLQAFELFLQDVYGEKRILREGVVPLSPILSSPHFQHAAIGLPRPQGYHLHLSGICLVRNREGRLMVRHQHFSRATGISYMMQNRRAAARVIPELFQEQPILSLAEIPLAIVEKLRSSANSTGEEPAVVMLSPGTGSAVYSEHTFLARRMGIPLVFGGDLVVLDDCVFLKTVQGLKRVDAICNYVSDPWLDPMVFRPESLIGTPGLVHCLRRGTVTLLNGIGSQLADDRSLLALAPKIIRFYLRENPILPSVPTFWLGDIDQREMVLDDPEAYDIQPIFGDDIGSEFNADSHDLRRNASRLIAQPRGFAAKTLTLEGGNQIEREQDHIVFALRSGDDFQVFPGALTRVFVPHHGWTSRDTWVLGQAPEPMAPRRIDVSLPSRQVTSRVAEAFYWLGRYLERTYHQGYLIQVVETLETEELNSAERKLYRPMWNRLLPPLEASGSPRSITTRLDRYRLLLAPESSSVLSTFGRAMVNAESVQECLSPEAWSALSDLRGRFNRSRFKETISENDCVKISRKLSEAVTRQVPQFFATAESSMLADDGWRFCVIGQLFERAVITANAAHSIAKSLVRNTHGSDIELSAFLRLLGTRDAYRRVFQMRAEPVPVLELLFQNSQAPRSVMRCLQQCAQLLQQSAESDSPATSLALGAIEALISRIQRIDWQLYIRPAADERTPITPPAAGERAHELEPLLAELLAATLDIHLQISDGFLSHQANIALATQPLLHGI